MPLIYCLLGGYMLPIPPFRGTRNNHWKDGCPILVCPLGFVFFGLTFSRLSWLFPETLCPCSGLTFHEMGWLSATVKYEMDGSKIWRSPVEVGSFSHYLQGFIHPRWCRIRYLEDHPRTDGSVVNNHGVNLVSPQLLGVVGPRTQMAYFFLWLT